MVKDPPFSRLDLISCRNLLIYLDERLQKRVIPLFHYALNPAGFLFLGSSETVGEFGDLFAAVDRQSKLFQRRHEPPASIGRTFGRVPSPAASEQAAAARCRPPERPRREGDRCAS